MVACSSPKPTELPTVVKQVPLKEFEGNYRVVQTGYEQEPGEVIAVTWWNFEDDSLMVITGTYQTEESALSSNELILIQRYMDSAQIAEYNRNNELMTREINGIRYRFMNSTLEEYGYSKDGNSIDINWGNTSGSYDIKWSGDTARLGSVYTLIPEVPMSR